MRLKQMHPCSSIKRSTCALVKEQSAAEFSPEIPQSRQVARKQYCAAPAIAQHNTERYGIALAYFHDELGKRHSGIP